MSLKSRVWVCLGNLSKGGREEGREGGRGGREEGEGGEGVKVKREWVKPLVMQLLESLVLHEHVHNYRHVQCTYSMRQ